MIDRASAELYLYLVLLFRWSNRLAGDRCKEFFNLFDCRWFCLEKLNNLFLVFLWKSLGFFLGLKGNKLEIDLAKEYGFLAWYFAFFGFLGDKVTVSAGFLTGMDFLTFVVFRFVTIFSLMGLGVVKRVTIVTILLSLKPGRGIHGLLS